MAVCVKVNSTEKAEAEVTLGSGRSKTHETAAASTAWSTATVGSGRSKVQATATASTAWFMGVRGAAEVVALR